MIKFPKDFLWGAASAAYQVEGGNANSDWWYWELEKNKEIILLQWLQKKVG